MRTQCNKRRGLVAVALLLMCSPSPKAGAQQASIKPKTVGAPAQGEQKGRTEVTIRVSNFRPAMTDQEDKRLDSNGANELEAALQRAVGRKGNLKLYFQREEAVNDIILAKKKLENLGAPSANPIPAQFQYQITTTYTLSPGRFDAHLVEANSGRYSTVSADFNKGDPDPTARLGLNLVNELRSLLGRPAPSYKLLLPCFQIDGKGDAAKSEEMTQARKLARNFVSGVLNDLWLMELVVPPGENACDQVSGSEAQEKNDLYLVGKITVFTLAASGTSSSGPITLYYFSLEVVRGPQRQRVDSIDSEACKQLPDLVEMARRQAEQLKPRLNNPDLQEKLEID